MERIQKVFGGVIRRRRERLRLSQEAFADKAGIHRTYISSIELGKVQVSIGIAWQLASALEAGDVVLTWRAAYLPAMSAIGPNDRALKDLSRNRGKVLGGFGHVSATLHKMALSVISSLKRTALCSCNTNAI